MNASRLFAADARKRNRLGWPLAFIAPRIPRPRSVAELAVHEIFNKRLDDKAESRSAIERIYSLHIYTVLELMELAYKAGKDNQK